MSSLPTPLSEEQAREGINRWAAQGFYRLRNMGDKIFVDEIVGGWAFSVRLQTHYEERSVSHAQEPYLGGPVDDSGRPPQPWDIPVRRPGEFQERTETLPVPHTERVLMCAACGGDGKVVCGGCGGSGQAVCPSCMGSGVLRQQLTDTTTGSQGEQVPSVRIVERPCGCRGGRIRCPTCSAQGRVVCGSCRGSGQVKTYDRLIVKFLHSRHGDIFDVTPVPDNWFGKLTGESLVDQRGPKVETFDAINDEVDGRARKLLDRSHQIDPARTRILLQHLQIDRIPLHEVRYKYAGVERKLWLCGTEQQVYAPNSPWNRARLVGTILGGVLGVLAVVGGLVGLWYYLW